ncbi:helix-turn-helix transcriptional regulator [Ensifer sp. YR511]|uniref:helix-turn-helix domain-containing protein n=1 Tax=Ensifer sp. YR511 TaxID=1855294 RepID=UPI000B7D68C8
MNKPKSSKRADAVDLQIGKRVLQRRNALGLSQSQLAQQLGISFQLVHNIESGKTRVSATRLQRLSLILRAPIEYFLEEVANPVGPHDTLAPSEIELSGVASGAEGFELSKAFMRISDLTARRELILLVESIVEAQVKVGG